MYDVPQLRMTAVVVKTFWNRSYSFLFSSNIRICSYGLVFHIGTFSSDQAAIASNVDHWLTEHTDFLSRILEVIFIPAKIFVIFPTSVIEKNKVFQNASHDISIDAKFDADFKNV